MRQVKVHLYRRSDDQCHRYWYHYTGHDGVRVRRIAGETREEAENVCRELERKLNTGNLDPELTSVAEFFEEYLATVAVSAQTRDNYQLTLNRFTDLFGPLGLVQITPHHVREFMGSLNHLAPATQLRSLRELAIAFNYGVKAGYLSKNPCALVKGPRLAKNPPRILTKLQVRQLLKSVRDTRYHAVLATAVYAGLRRGELVWLEWEDVDLSRGNIHVRNKTAHSLKDYEARTVPIPRALVDVLKKLPRETAWVFPSPAGMRWDAVNLSHRLVPYFEKLQVKGKLHLLRHTYASHLAMAGVDLGSVQKLLGHSSITTTMIYSHYSQDHLAKQVQRLEY